MEGVVKTIKGIVSGLVGALASPPGAPKADGARPMKYPYTFSAKIAQFPIRHYMKHNWTWRYYILYSIPSCIPVFWYIHGMSNSEGNKEQWREIRRKEAAEAHH